MSGNKSVSVHDVTLWILFLFRLTLCHFNLAFCFIGASLLLLLFLLDCLYLLPNQHLPVFFLNVQLVNKTQSTRHPSVFHHHSALQGDEGLCSFALSERWTQNLILQRSDTIKEASCHHSWKDSWVYEVHLKAPWPHLRLDIRPRHVTPLSCFSFSFSSVVLCFFLKFFSAFLFFFPAQRDSPLHLNTCLHTAPKQTRPCVPYNSDVFRVFRNCRRPTPTNSWWQFSWHAAALCRAAACSQIHVAGTHCMSA